MAKTKKSSKASDKEVTMNRRASADRRDKEDRRTGESTVATERRQSPRRKVPRRRQIDPTTCERDYNIDEIEFMQALDAYKRANGRMFPTCSEILEVIRDLGYRKIADSSDQTEQTTDQSESTEGEASEPATTLAVESIDA